MNKTQHHLPDWANADYLLDIGGHKKVLSLKLSKNSDGSYDSESYIQLVFEHLEKKLPRTQSFWKREKRVKSNETSKMFREEGNKLFRLNLGVEGTKKMIELYTTSIVFAIPGSEALALGYANRSAVLDKANRPQECLDDIENALRNNYPENKKPKLLKRQGDNYAKLAEESHIHAKFWFNKVPLNDDVRHSLKKQVKGYKSVTKSEKILDEEDIIPEIKSPSEKYPCASDGIDIQYSKTFGRHIVATRDIDPGEILVVDRKFVSYLDDRKVHNYCNHCTKFVWTGIPCDECINIVYCSERCKTAAWKEYHCVECNLFDILMQYPFTSTFCLNQATRLLLQISHEAGGWQGLKERLKNLPDAGALKKWPLRKDWYTDNSLERVLTLSSNTDKWTEEMVKLTALINVRSTFFLAAYTNFFGTRYDRKKMSDNNIFKLMSSNADYKICAGLLSRLTIIAKFNNFMIEEYNSGDFISRGAGISLFLSYFNHSCNPNVWVQQKTNHSILYALYPIKKGQQIFTHYKVLFGSHEKKERDQYLEESGFFTCTCEACRENWPPYNFLPTYKIKAKSPQVAEKLKHDLEVVLPDMYQKIKMQRNFRDKDEMLDKLWKMMKEVYEGVQMPCKDVTNIVQTIIVILDACGNTAKLQSKFAKKL